MKLQFMKTPLLLITFLWIIFSGFSQTTSNPDVNVMYVGISVTDDVTYTPNAGFLGLDTLTYKVMDENGNTATAIQNITVLPAGAANTTAAADDYATTPFDTPVTANALDNDTGAEGDGQMATPQATAITGVGTLGLAADGSYTFTPEMGFVGPVEFPYEITDDNGSPVMTNATIHILVQELAAVAPNNALNFQSSGSNQVVIPDNAAFDFSSGFTMEAWVKPTAFTASRTIFSQYSGSQRAFSAITKSDGSVEVTVSTTGTSEAYYITANKLTLDVWQHVALTYDGTSVQFYINGIEAGIDGSVVGTISGAMHNSTEPILLGSRSNTLFYEGDMDEVRIWTRALTITEINDQQSENIPSTTTGLVAYYKMDQGIAGGDNTAITTLTDSGVNGLNGTLTGFTKTGATSNFVSGAPSFSDTLGVNESIFNDSEMPIVYPNPINDGLINIKISNTLLVNNKKLTYKVYNTVGGIIKEGVLTDVENQISVGYLASGIYMVKISNNENAVVKKLIVK